MLLARGRTWAAVRGGADEDGADAAAFLESEAATIPAQIADECSKLAAAAAAAAPTPTLGKGEEVGGDDDDAMAIDTFVERTDALEPPAPREYDLNSFELLRSADVFEGFDGAGGQRPPAPLGFPVWSQRFAKCRVAHGSLLPLLELHSIASQMTLLEVVSTRLARVSLASTVESTPLTKEATRARLTADELAAAARGLSFGRRRRAPRDPVSISRRTGSLLWLARADGGDDRLAESIPSLAHAPRSVVARLGVGRRPRRNPSRAPAQTSRETVRDGRFLRERFRIAGRRTRRRPGTPRAGPSAASAPPQPSSPSPSSRPTGAWTAWRRDRRGRFSSGWRLERSA